MNMQLGELLVCPGGKECRCLDGPCKRLSKKKIQQMKERWKRSAEKMQIVFDPFGKMVQEVKRRLEETK